MKYFVAYLLWLALAVVALTPLVVLLAACGMTALDRQAISQSRTLTGYAYAHCGDAGQVCAEVRAAHCLDESVMRRNSELPDAGTVGAIRCEP